MIHLIFTGGQGPSCYDLEKALSFLFGIDKNDKSQFYCIASDSGATLASSCGFMPQHLIGDMDSISLSKLEALKQESILIDKYQQDKDDSDTLLALKRSHRDKKEATVLIGGGGGRVDHLLAIFQDLTLECAPDYWITDANIMIVLKQIQSYKINLSKKSTVSIFALEPFTRLETKGLKWELNDSFNCSVRYSLSNVTCDDFFEIDLKAGKALIVMPLSL